MDTRAIEKFMYPNLLFPLCFTGSIFLSSLFGLILVFCNDTFEGSVFGGCLFLLAGSMFLFYALVYYEFKVYRDRIEAYKANGELESLAAEFRDAQESFCKGRMRLGSRHIFVKGESKVFAYEDILTIEIRVIREENQVCLYLSQKDHAFQDPLRSVKWRQKDGELQDAISAIVARNPEIKVVRTQM